jgi:hypothetical protein
MFHPANNCFVFPNESTGPLGTVDLPFWGSVPALFPGEHNVGYSHGRFDDTSFGMLDLHISLLQLPPEPIRPSEIHSDDSLGDGYHVYG